MVTSRASSRLFRCDPQCLTAGAYAYNFTLRKTTCASPSPTYRNWGDGLRVHCIAWTPTSLTTLENNLVQDGKTFSGGVQNFGTSATTENLVYAAGSFRSVLDVSSWVWWVYAENSQTRATAVHTFAPGVQIVGPIAYVERIRRVYVPVHDHNDKAKRFIIYQVSGGCVCLRERWTLHHLGLLFPPRSR